jgi:hypothetical protein
MNTEFDRLEQQLNTLRPARLPATARQRIVREMEQPVSGSKLASWLFGHRAGFQVALAGALSVALLMGVSHLPRTANPTSDSDESSMVTVNALLPSLVLWETQVAAASPVNANTVAGLRSPSILTNIQIRR